MAACPPARWCKTLWLAAPRRCASPRSRQWRAHPEQVEEFAKPPNSTPARSAPVSQHHRPCAGNAPCSFIRVKPPGATSIRPLRSGVNSMTDSAPGVSKRTCSSAGISTTSGSGSLLVIVRSSCSGVPETTCACGVERMISARAPQLTSKASASNSLEIFMAPKTASDRPAEAYPAATHPASAEIFVWPGIRNSFLENKNKICVPSRTREGQGWVFRPNAERMPVQ